MLVLPHKAEQVYYSQKNKEGERAIGRIFFPYLAILEMKVRSQISHHIDPLLHSINIVQQGTKQEHFTIGMASKRGG
jgi:hypothetical protein